jgi:hypothetical protein
VPCVALRAEVAALAMRTSATLQTHQERPMSERLRVPCWQVSADRVSYRYGYRDRRWDTPEGRGAARGGSADPSGEANDLGRPTGRQMTDSSLPAQMVCSSSLRSAARARSMSKHHTVLRLPASHRPWVAAP